MPWPVQLDILLAWVFASAGSEDVALRFWGRRDLVQPGVFMNILQFPISNMNVQQ